MKKKKLTTTRISPEALEILRNVSDMTGERQYRIIDRMLKAELDKQAQEETKDKQLQGEPA